MLEVGKYSSTQNDHETMKYNNTWQILGCYGILLISFFLLPNNAKAQCDFISDITGLTQSVASGADPSNYTQVYALVDCNDQIYATSNSPDFTGVEAGLYDLRAINYANTESTTVNALLDVGDLWDAVVAYGTSGGCIDYTAPYGGCAISVCTEETVLETDVINFPTSGMNTSSHVQNYCLVCDGDVVAFNASSTFDLNAIPEAYAGANCQVFAYNYQDTDADPLSIGDTWVPTTNPMVCLSTQCLNYAGMRLNIELILPVELLEFEAEKHQLNQSLLYWETASEENNDGFYILRSKEGNQWEELSFISASGSTSAQRYSFIDKTPFDGDNYYRLRQKDRNGKTTLSPVRHLNFNKNNSDKPQVTVMPNPHNDNFNVYLTGVSTNGIAKVELIDALGRSLWIKDFPLQEGAFKANINTSNYQSGIFMLKVQFENTQVIKRCIKK